MEIVREGNFCAYMLASVAPSFADFFWWDLIPSFDVIEVSLLVLDGGNICHNSIPPSASFLAWRLIFVSEDNVWSIFNLG
ncbi:unnamed protein product [Sphenostylis stenocarpa]|uniref:Uncharacterized protein n=1 Tax=Sphenostylis stenocarpa TaxID=92480 RepID=A0AA86RYF8_9FABA|nr:unnamed protein product [Sphenostylis stenocarpa]